MTEMQLQIIASLKLLLVAGFATLYGLGGMSGKWKRRFIAPGTSRCRHSGVHFMDTIIQLVALAACALTLCCIEYRLRSKQHWPKNKKTRNSW